MTVELRIYDGCKYFDDTEEITRRKYNIEKYEVKTISDDEMHTKGFNDVDEFQEYLILTFENGDTVIFGNSYVDMFKVG